MKKIAVIFESSPFDRKGLFNAVHNRIFHLMKEDGFCVDAYCMHIKDSFISRRLRKTAKVPVRKVVEVDGISYRMLWRRFSYTDELRRRFSKAPAALLAYAASIVPLFKDYDALAAHSYEAGLVALEVHRRFGIPYTVTWHGSDMHTHPMKDATRRGLTSKIMESAAMNFFVSQTLLEVSSKITDDAAKSVLYNGVSESFRVYDESRKSLLRRKYSLSDNDMVVAYVGNFHPVKNVAALPELFSCIHSHFEAYISDNPDDGRNLVFWVIGDGKLRPRLEPEIICAAGTDVKFWGNVAAEEMPDMMNCIDALVLPSRNEGLPLVSLEALKCGVSVLGSEAGGIPEVIGKEFCVPFEAGRDGVFDYTSPVFAERLAQKVVGQLLYPKQQLLDPRFSWERTARMEAAVLKELLG